MCHADSFCGSNHVALDEDRDDLREGLSDLLHPQPRTVFDNL